MPIGRRPAPPAGTARLILQGLSQTHPWAAIQWLNITAGSPAQADLQSIVGSISSSWNTNFGPQVTAQTSLSSVEAVWTPTAGTEILATDSTVHTGTLSATVVADASACFVLNWRLNAYYRGGHPRTFLPGVYTAAVTNGSDVVSGYASSLQTSAAAFLTAVNALTHGSISAVQLGTVSFQSGNAWRTPPIFRAFTGVGVGSKIGTQRRRIGR